MQLGYYWAHHTKHNQWRIVEVAQGLHGAVLEGGFSVPVSEFDEIDPEPIVRREEPTELRERLAEYAHEAWSNWMRWMFNRGGMSMTSHVEGEELVYWAMSPTSFERWQQQMNTEFSALPDAEKQSDYVEADKILAIFQGES